MDTDPEESAEWQDALDSLHRSGGPQRGVSTRLSRLPAASAAGFGSLAALPRTQNPNS
jgi:hypothetical protein